jgi:regulator of cell morphogenesis and NO signaling
MNTFNSAQSLGEIVSIMPKAGEVFKQYKIDFCCGGNRPLIEAIKEQNLNENEILKKLDEAFIENEKIKNATKDFREMSPTELIKYIENKHHAYVKKALPELSELTTKIMRVHGINHDVLFRVHKLFSAMKADLEQHLYKEEELLFPLIEEYDLNPSGDHLVKIRKVIKELEDEHEAAGNILKELRKITEEYKVPEDGCSTYSMTFNKLEEFEADLFQHIHLENNILFKKLGINVNTM